MKLYIKNMVCNRCKMVVKAELEKLNIQHGLIALGEVEIEQNLSETTKSTLNKNLQTLGFELLSEKKGQIIEKVKNIVVESIHHSSEKIDTTFSIYLAHKLHHDYSFLSKLFSDAEGITLEQYIIAQRIEKVKELLVYDELTISEIANKMNYSSNAHLSRQFKTVTGFTPSGFKKLKHHNRRPIEEI